MKRIAKLMLAVSLLTAGAALQAKVLPGWMPTQGGLLKANPGIIADTDNAATLKGLASGNWVCFKPGDPIQAVKGDQVEITLKVSSCKGKVSVGFFEYSQGFKGGGVSPQIKVLKEVGAPEEIKFSIPVKSNRTKLVRPQITLAPGSELVLNSLTCKVVKAPAQK